MFDIALLVICGGFVSFAAWMIFDTLRRMKVVTNRRIYIQCVARLEVVTVMLNQMEGLARHSEDKKALDRYEEALKMTESLLTALNKVPILPEARELVTRLQPMVVQLEKTTGESIDLFRESLRKKGGLGQFFKDVDSSSPPVKGCYFCSRPYSPKTFKKVGIKLNTEKLKVYGCSICRAALKAKGTVDVLYFKSDNKDVHWSETPGYDPKKDFWNLGRRAKEVKRPKLELLPGGEPSD